MSTTTPKIATVIDKWSLFIGCFYKNSNYIFNFIVSRPLVSLQRWSFAKVGLPLFSRFYLAFRSLTFWVFWHFKNFDLKNYAVIITKEYFISREFQETNQWLPELNHGNLANILGGNGGRIWQIGEKGGELGKISEKRDKVVD